MSEVSAIMGRWAEGNRRNLLKVAYRRDPDSSLDEVLIACWVVMVLSVVVTTSFGIFYHYQIFKSVSGNAVAGVGASMLFLILVEICKMFFGLHLGRALLNGVWNRSFKHLFFTLFLALIVTGAFAWSIFISTKGVKQVNQSIKAGHIYATSDFTPPPSIADLDRQIAELDKAKAAGAKATWRGRTTQGGIDVIKANTDLQAKLIQQREILLTSARNTHDSMTNTMLLEVKNTSTLLADYGGKSEYATILLILLIATIEIIIWEKNKHLSPEPETAKK